MVPPRSTGAHIRYASDTGAANEEHDPGPAARDHLDAGLADEPRLSRDVALERS